MKKPMAFWAHGFGGREDVAGVSCFYLEAALSARMESSQFLKLLQRNLAQRAVGPSALRKQGSKGLIECCREQLAAVDLDRLREIRPAKFEDYLNEETAALLEILAPFGCQWGAARKALNLFMRDLFYNYFIREAVGLAKLEECLEVPVDSHVIKGLVRELDAQTTISVPKFPGIVRLNPALNSMYQAASAIVGRNVGVARVHLDILWWRADDI